MPESLNLHEPLLVNTIGHAAGAIVFGLLLALLLRDHGRRGAGPSWAAIWSAALALVWNAASLVALSPWAAGSPAASVAAALGFASLSALPALLFSISLRGEAGGLRAAGWAASALAVALHVAELLLHDPRLHRIALLSIAAAFATLSLLSLFAVHARRKRISGVLVPVALILFAGSFVHFGETSHSHLWSEEIALHHAGIPLALFIVLQDYRFLMVDAFVRMIASGGLAAAMTLAALYLNERARLLERAAADAFLAGLLAIGACAALVMFAYLRGRLQTWVTRRVFRRPSIDSALAQLLEPPPGGGEREFLAHAARVAASHMGAERLELREDPAASRTHLLPESLAAALPGPDAWVRAVVPFHFSRGDSALLLLGRRAGGRGYFSEDLRELSQLAVAAAGQVERIRAERVEQLATQAELRALHAQINPHFLFNSLNALYGTIPREAAGARRMVLNLSDIFRYFLQTERTTIPLGEEIRIVRAYLEIEQLRLGDRLRTEVRVDPAALDTPVPPLCIQPLVENGIRHGIAGKPGPGRLALLVDLEGGRVRVRVEDSGGELRPTSESRGNGVGLDNVRQRLAMMCGARLEIAADGGRTVAGFDIPYAQHPARSPAEAAR